MYLNYFVFFFRYENAAIMNFDSYAIMLNDKIVGEGIQNIKTFILCNDILSTKFFLDQNVLYVDA